MSTPTKITKATATQNSASANILSSALEHVGDCGLDLAACGRGAGQALDDGCGRIGGDALDVDHGGRPARRDGLLGLGYMGIELGLERLAGALGGLGLAFAGLVGERLGAAAGIGQRFLIGDRSRVRVRLQPFRFGEITRDALLAVLDDRADARQRDARHQEIESHERQRDPEQLRGKGVLVERRKAGAMFRGRNMLRCLDLLGAVWCHCGLQDVCADVSAMAQAPAGRLRRSRLVSDQKTNRSSSAISSEKMPSASVTAKPKIRLPNWPWAADGLRSAAAR